MADTTLIRGEGITTLAAASDEKLRKDVRRAATGGQLLFLVKRPEKISPEDWRAVYPAGAAETEDKKAPGATDGKPIIEPLAREAIGVSIRDRNNDQALLDVTLPQGIKLDHIQKWNLVSVFCNGKDSKLLGYASAKVVLVSKNYSFYSTIIIMATFWMALAFATFQFYRDKFFSYMGRRQDLILQGTLWGYQCSTQLVDLFPIGKPTFHRARQPGIRQPGTVADFDVYDRSWRDAAVLFHS